MINYETLSRPYAKALFDLSKQDDTYQVWLDNLNILDQLFKSQKFKNFIFKPCSVNQQVTEVLNFFDFKSNMQDFAVKFKNFVFSLTQNKRLNLVSYITEAFIKMKYEDEGILRVKVSSAYQLSDDKLLKLSSSLERRFNSKVELESSIDTSLLGGVRVQADDLVIDNSVQGRIKKMSQILQV